MFYKTKDLTDYKLKALNGEIGKVKDVYFDDKYWTVRYLTVNTGSWLTGRKVLISPYAFLGVSPENEQISVDLTMKQIEDSPPLDADKPVSRQFEWSYYDYYGWPRYWYGPYSWGGYYYIPRPSQTRIPVAEQNKWDPNLRSTDEVTGYSIKAQDGNIGHVEDFLIDDETWAIRYLIVDTRDWLPGKRVLVSPQWVQKVSWDNKEVAVDLEREIVKQAPEYSGKISRDYEEQLYKHYNREGYWERETASKFVKAEH